MQKLLENLAATAELMGQQVSPIALSVMAEDLKDYRIEIVIEALSLLRRESKGHFSLAAVIEKIEVLQPDGRPGADEAWAMYPHDEASTAVVTQEMHEAMYFAGDLDDQVAARMAFKDAYTRIVAEKKRAGIAPAWKVSLGHDVAGRAPALAEAVRLGRIGSKEAIGLLHPSDVAPMLQMAGKEKLALEYKIVSDEEVMKNLSNIKEMLVAKMKVAI